MSNWRHHRAFIGKKVPENGPFRDQFWRGVGHLAPLTGKSSGTFSPMNALWRRQFDIDENETNCVNYKYCLVDAPGVSNSCID